MGFFTEKANRVREEITRKIKGPLHKHSEEDEEVCPHCGYYCNGKSAFCTKGKGAFKDED